MQHAGHCLQHPCISRNQQLLLNGLPDMIGTCRKLVSCRAEQNLWDLSRPEAMEVSISMSIWDRPCSSLLLMLFTSVEPPLDQIVAEDRLLRLLLHTHSSARPLQAGFVSHSEVTQQRFWWWPQQEQPE